MPINPRANLPIAISVTAMLVCLALVATSTPAGAGDWTPSQSKGTVQSKDVHSKDVPSKETPATSSIGKQGGKLQWLPYRPSKPADRSAVRSGKVVAAKWVAQISSGQTSRTSPAAGSPFDDPFGDQRSHPPSAVARPSAVPHPAADHDVQQEEEPGPLFAEANLQPPPQEPLAPPLTEPSEPAFDPGALQSTQADEEELDFSIPPMEVGEWKSQVVQRECPTPGSKEFYTPIGELTADISIKPDQKQTIDLDEPRMCGLSDDTLDPHTLRNFQPTTFTWKASGLCHKPLYFEDVQLERYGHSHGPYLQPVISGAHFFLTIPTLPYQMAGFPPDECMYTLGYYRPGNCAPYMVDPLPLSIRAALAEGGIWTAAFFLIP